MVEIGQRQHLVTIETPGPSVPDNDGGYTRAFTELGKDWVSIEPATARDLERVVAGSVQSTASHVVRMKYRPGVTTASRIRFGTRTLQVTGVQNPGERNIDLILTCEESVG